MQESINLSDVDLRRDLYNGVLLAGEHEHYFTARSLIFEMVVQQNGCTVTWQVAVLQQWHDICDAGSKELFNTGIL